MNKKRQFNDILDECFERLRRGESLEQCLAAYPEHAVELKPLLQTVAMVRQVAAVTPRPGAEIRFQHRLQQTVSPRPQPRPRLSAIFGWSRPLVTVMSAFLVIVIAGGGTVAAASYSMPDSALYPVKQATEQVRVTLARSDVAKAELYVELAETRVKEITYLSEKRQASRQKVDLVSERLDEALDKVVDLASVPVAMAPVATFRAEEATLSEPPEAKGRDAKPMAPEPMLETTLVPEPARGLTTTEPMMAAGKSASPQARDARSERVEKRLEELEERETELKKALLRAPNDRARLAILKAIEVSEQGRQQFLESAEEDDD